MKLELKHLAPYLPYGLKLFYTHTEKIGQISNIYSIGEGFDNDDIKISIDYSEGEHIWMYKPILRPLADLSKLGVENIPINEHTINMLIQENFNEDYGMFEHYKSVLSFVKEGDSSQMYDSRKTIDFEIFEFVRCELLKSHYDIFGLIEKGLAIDINTLKP